MTSDEIQAWAAAYIEAQKDPDLLKGQGDHPLWWAVEQFMGATTDVSPHDCWAAILEVLSRSPPEKIVGGLAAGPLEDLIHYHGPEFIEQIESESRRNPAFRRLLCGVWQSSTPEIWSRIQKAQGRV